MASRSIWSGTITFGLVNVPIKLYSAVDPEADVKFCQIHTTCKGKVSQKRYCATCEKEVLYEEIGKGFPQENPVVQILDSEIEALRPKAAKSIEIEAFVQGPIDYDYVEKPYRILPDSTGTKPFVLLREAMFATGTVAVGKFVMRQRAYPVMIRLDHEGLTMHQLRWANELRPPMVAADVALTEQELKLATMLVHSLTSESPLSEWADEYSQKVLELVEAKVAGEPLPEGAEEVAAPAVDLMAALEASLQAAGG